MRHSFTRKKVKKDYLKEFLTGKKNVSPPCPHYDDCGGCDLQEYSYEEQLNAKLNSFISLVKDRKLATRFIDSPITVLASPRQTNYRQKMDFVCALGHSGLRGGSFDRIVDVESCQLIENESFAAYKRALELVKEAKLEFYNYKKHCGFLRYITVRRTRAGEQLIALLTNSKEKSTEVKKIAETLFNEELVDSFIWQILQAKTDSSFGTVHKFWGKEFIEEKILGYRFKVSANTFFQTNQEIAEAAYAMIQDHVRENRPTQLLDLYSGTCTIGISLAGLVEKIIAVENFPANRDMAMLNFAANEVTNIDYIDTDVKPFMAGSQLTADYVVCNPPRTGIDEKTLRRLVEMKPKAISYLSCNPKTLLDDLNILSFFYKIDKAVVLDMFPQTKHFETLVQMRLL